jgi:predicted PhzF superfamily epimerase YddE/YHI9
MIDKKTIYQVDAFTDEPFKGNPAGVMIVDEQIDSYRIQKIATEMNLSETAFIMLKGDLFEIRYFTPSVEVSLCGHATLASGHIIYELGLVSLMITAKSNTKNFDFVVRCFVPMLGINEDPVTGSAHCALLSLVHNTFPFLEYNILFPITHKTFLQSPIIQGLIRKLADGELTT